MPPTSVTPSSSSICSGSPDTVKVNGGKLGTGASWKWYTDSACTNAAAGTFNADKTQLTASPTSTTTYYVAEGTCGNTVVVSAKILVYLSRPSAIAFRQQEESSTPATPLFCESKAGRWELRRELVGNGIRAGVAAQSSARLLKERGIH